MKTIFYVIISLLFASLPSIVLADESTPLIDIDFSRATIPHSIHRRGSFSGPLPLGVVADFPSWNKGEAITSPHSENGRGFLRFSVGNVDSTRKGPAGERLLFFAGYKTCIQRGYYKLQVEGRFPQGLSVNIRQGPPSFTAFWRADFPPDSDWKTHEALLEIKPIEKIFVRKLINIEPKDLKLTFSLIKKGDTDLGSIKLYKASLSERAIIDARTRAREEVEMKIVIRPPLNSSNFLRNSCFPLGLPSGWCYARSYPSVKINADASDPGPSGNPSMKIENIELYSETFNTPVQDVRECEITLSYKAQRDFKLSVIAANLNQKRDCIDGVEKQLSSFPIKASAQWNTVSLRFIEPKSRVKCLYLKFSNAGILKLDSLTVRYANVGKDVCADQCEVALAPANSELAGERVQFADEAPLFRFYVSGDYKGGVLKLRLYDANGLIRALPAPSLEQNHAGELAYLSGQDSTRLGPFRIEAWIERDGKQISPCNELVLTRVRRPVYWGKDAPASPFATVLWPQKARSLKAAGINWARLHDDGGMRYTGWAYVEPEKGRWTFQDKAILYYRNAGLLLIGSLYTVPHWASYYDGVKRPAYFDVFCQPKNLSDYENYVRTVVSHYKGTISEYIIWNEPTWEGHGNDSYYWHKTYNPATRKIDKNLDSIKEFIDLSRVAYRTAKAVDPSVRLIGINAGHQNWIDKMFAGGAYSFCDTADLHFYSGEGLLGIPGDDMEKMLGPAVNMAKKAGVDIMNSEGNGLRRDPNIDPTGAAMDKGNDGTGIYRHSIAWRSASEPVEIADSLCRFVMKNLVLGMKRVVLYSEACNLRLAVVPSFHVMLGADGFPTPAYAAFSNLAWLLEDRKFVRCFPVGKNVWAYVFDGHGSRVAVISGMKNGTYQAPKTESIRCLDIFGNTSPGVYHGTLLYLVSDLPSEQLERIITEPNIKTK